MAIARKCDRCGKFYEYYPKGNKVQANGVQRIYREKSGCLRYETTFDFCPECMAAFDEFMINGKFMEEKHGQDHNNFE